MNRRFGCLLLAASSLCFVNMATAPKRGRTLRAAEGAEGGRVVILGAGLQGSALAYYLTRRGVKPLVVEREQVAAAASGKGGGFLARDWGDAVTTELHTATGTEDI